MYHNDNPGNVSRRDSAGSQTPSVAYSTTPSTRPILTGPMNADYLGPPSAVPLRASSPAPSTHSLAANYLPSKFSNTLISRRRAAGGGRGGLGAVRTADLDGVIPRGGGVDAFRSGAARIPGARDEDDDDEVGARRGRGGGKLRWTRFKTILFVANCVLSVYSLGALVFTLLVWFRTLKDAHILIVGNHPELVLSTLAATAAFATSLLGFPGILLNARPFLAVYTLLLWVDFALLVTPGYVTFKRRNLNLPGKLNQQWSQNLGAAGRLVVQNALHCCGYENPFVEATVSATCYARSVLVGCKGPYLDFQRVALERWYTVAFALVPLQIGVMVAALLCSNHVTYRFGKGMMPKAYRLSKASMAVITERYAAQLAEQYGADAAAHMMASASNSSTGLAPGGFPSSANSSEVNLTTFHRENQHIHQPQPQQHNKYDSVELGVRDTTL